MVVGVGRGIAGRGRYEVGDGEGASTEEDDEGQHRGCLVRLQRTELIYIYLKLHIII